MRGTSNPGPAAFVREAGPPAASPPKPPEVNCPLESRAEIVVESRPTAGSARYRAWDVPLARLFGAPKRHPSADVARGTYREGGAATRPKQGGTAVSWAPVSARRRGGSFYNAQNLWVYLVMAGRPLLG